MSGPAHPATLADVGLAVGHATDVDGGTGLTVVRGVGGALRAGVAVLGRATGSRELATAAPSHLVHRIDAILLTGGSAYGLDAAAGVMRWMEERGRGFPVGAGVVPIVPGAVVFDLAPLGRFEARPTAAMAYDACDAASGREVAEGSVGAGAGCTVGKGLGAERAMKGGVGCAVVERDGVLVGAVAVVNAFGDVRDGRGAIIAGARGDDGGFADTRALVAAGMAHHRFGGALQNTTLAVVATNVSLGRTELTQLAAAAGAALGRRITPAGTTFDGDVVFAVCAADDGTGDGTGEGPGHRAGGPPGIGVSGGAGAVESTDRAGREGRAGRPGGRDELATPAGSGTTDGAPGLRGAPPQAHDTRSFDERRHPPDASNTTIARQGAAVRPGALPLAVPPDAAAPADLATLLALEVLAAEALEVAIERAVRLARGRDGIPGLADV